MDAVHDLRLVDNRDGAVGSATPGDSDRIAGIRLPQFDRIVHFLTVAGFLQLEVL